jgi:putative endonuclease
VTKKKTVWFVYIIESEKGNLYTGITTDLERRFQEHLHSKAKGAKFFRTQKALRIVYQEHQKNRSLASKRESFIKKLTRKSKLKLISSIT